MRIENQEVRVTVTAEGGYIAEIRDLATGVNPLWEPPWFHDERPDYGNDAESRLLAGIRGHNLCLGLFGPPSEAEAAAGLVVHGEAGVTPVDPEVRGAGSKKYLRTGPGPAELRDARFEKQDGSSCIS